jgi:hypothetical protein
MLWGATVQAAELRGRDGARSSRSVVKRTAYQEPEAEMEEVTPEPPKTTPAKPKAKAAAPQPAPRVMQSAPPASAHSHQEYGWEDSPEMHEESSGYRPGMYLDESCESGACGVLDQCRGREWWGSADYLLWWRRGAQVPALVTTATVVNDPDIDGELGQNTTRILLGADAIDDRSRPGGRIDFGMWLDSDHMTGIGTRFTGLANDEMHFRINNTTNNILTIPFFNLDAAVNGEDTLVIAHPQTGATGNINVDTRNSVYFGDVYLRKKLLQECDYHIDMVGGWFYSSLRESVVIDSTTLVGNRVNVRDEFTTRNNIHGGSIGLMAEFDRCYYRVNLLAKVALCNVRQTADVTGSTLVDGVAQNPAAGLFTQPSNIGTFTRDRFSAVPEFGVNWSYKLGCGVELTSGYSVVYWDHVLRAGNQIDRSVDNTQTVARPAFTFQDASYWAHGMNLGLTWTY